MESKVIVPSLLKFLTRIELGKKESIVLVMKNSVIATAEPIENRIEATKSLLAALLLTIK
tara:strand:- start:496 stop:675 length:180 start_codon:yes stop_codon:yes gene_type:complete